MPQWHRRQITGKKGVYFNYSFLDSLRKQNKSNEQFEFMLNNLTLEELIAMKLELSSKMLNGKLSGMRLWRSIPYIIRHGLLLYAISSTKSKYDASTLLGLSFDNYLAALKKYKIDLD
jgi:hypothetical protein